jgi:hypothetical protein
VTIRRRTVLPRTRRGSNRLHGVGGICTQSQFSSNRPPGHGEAVETDWSDSNEAASSSGKPAVSISKARSISDAWTRSYTILVAMLCDRSGRRSVAESA